MKAANDICLVFVTHRASGIFTSSYRILPKVIYAPHCFKRRLCLDSSSTSCVSEAVQIHTTVLEGNWFPLCSFLFCFIHVCILLCLRRGFLMGAMDLTCVSHFWVPHHNTRQCVMHATRYLFVCFVLALLESELGVSCLLVLPFDSGCKHFCFAFSLLFGIGSFAFAWPASDCNPPTSAF
jgi:hypothetical protein